MGKGICPFFSEFFNTDDGLTTLLNVNGITRCQDGQQAGRTLEQDLRVPLSSFSVQSLEKKNEDLGAFKLLLGCPGLKLTKRKSSKLRFLHQSHKTRRRVV